jgi:hypothetical protein
MLTAKCFLLGLSALTIYFLTLFGSAFWQYISLRESAPAHIEQWEIIEDKGGFVLRAKYSFTGRVGAYTFSSPRYLNEPSALMALKEKAKQPQTVWFSPAASFLEASFPFSYLIKTLVSLSALVYFVVLFKLK